MYIVKLFLKCLVMIKHQNSVQNTGYLWRLGGGCDLRGGRDSGGSAVFTTAGILKLGVPYVRFVVLCVILFLYILKYFMTSL